LAQHPSDVEPSSAATAAQASDADPRQRVGEGGSKLAQLVARRRRGRREDARASQVDGARLHARAWTRLERLEPALAARVRGGDERAADAEGRVEDGERLDVGHERDPRPPVQAADVRRRRRHERPQ
jgi:hypothetical protein